MKPSQTPRTHPQTLSFPKERTALLVIDPVNDFLSEGGAAYDLTKATLKLHNVVENMQRAIAGARDRGIPVLFGPMAYTEEDYADEALQRRSGINRFMFERKMFLAGSWGADFHPDLRPNDDEIVLLPSAARDVCGAAIRRRDRQQQIFPRTARSLSRADWIQQPANAGARRPDRPNNLWEPAPGDQAAHGRFDARAYSASPQLWASEHREWLALGAIIAVAAGLLGLWRRRG